MFSLQTMFGKSDQINDLLHASAKAALEAAKAVDQLTHGLNQDDTELPPLATFKAVRRREKKLAGRIGKKLIASFVTALDRDDIEAMNSALYEIPKTVERFAERYVLVVQRLGDVDFTPQTKILVECTQVLVDMIEELRNGFRIGLMSKLQDRLQALEAEADQLLLEPYRELYSTATNPIRVVLAKDLFEIMEKAIDDCRDVGNIVYAVVLKNS